MDRHGSPERTGPLPMQLLSCHSHPQMIHDPGVVGV